MKHAFLNRSALALVCAIGFASTPQAYAADAAPAAPAPATTHPMITHGATVLVVWELVSLLLVAVKHSKADFKQRAFLDMSHTLLRKNPKEWAQNFARNLEIAQRDYFEGQAYKGSRLKLNSEGKLEQSKKCLPYGFNGKLLAWIAGAKKANKNVKNVALLIFTLKGARSFSGGIDAFKTYMGWNDPTAKKDDTELTKKDIHELTSAVNHLAQATKEYNGMCYATAAAAATDDNVGAAAGATA